jgi:uncharacterized protein
MTGNPPSIDEDAAVRVGLRLRKICHHEGVSIPLAIESGSRAWGFPSPDSDYDCRFIFVRPMHQYLSPWPKRDVIESPLDGDLDINGWELGKALKLLLKGNAVVIEWLMSPIAYLADQQFRDECLALARRVADRDLLARHYLHLGERQRRTYFNDTRQVPLKKIFYALRPAAALRWLRHHPHEAIAPMHFPTLLDECDPSPEVKQTVAALLSQKAETRELGTGHLPYCIGEFIDSEFETARSHSVRENSTARAAFQTELEEFFRAVVLRFGKGGAAHGALSSIATTVPERGMAYGAD